MSSIKTGIRGLERNFKRFFNMVGKVPIKVLTALRVNVSYVNALHRIGVYDTGSDFIDAHYAVTKDVKEIPVGEIWVLENLLIALTTGTMARFDGFVVARKDAGVENILFSCTPAVSISGNRGIDWSEGNWLFPGDSLKVRVSTGNSGDKGRVIMERRIIRVGDDL